MKIEVILLLYNRPEHGAAVLGSLVENGVKSVRAFLDHSDEPAVRANQERLLAVIASRPEIRVELHRHARRQGLAGSVRFALNETLKDADSAIVLEDDCVVRPGGMEFFRQGLTRLRDDRRIRSVCGYLFPCPFTLMDGEPVLLRRFNPWGWATWRDRWESHDADLQRAAAALAARGIRIEDLGADLAGSCRPGSRADAWSFAWTLEHYLTDSYAVCPPASVIDNIGFDGSGQHCPSTSAFATIGRSGPKGLDWSRLVHHPENDALLKRFMDEHGPTIHPADR